MKKIIHSTALLMLVITCVLTSCKKSGCTDSRALNFDTDADKDDGSCQLAGLGGNTTIVALPQHHGMTIFNLAPDTCAPAGYPDTAYVKFNTQEFPGENPSSYDAAFAGSEGEDHVHIEGLKPGNYYIYMAGYDTTGCNGGGGNVIGRVKGGVPVKLTQASGEVEQLVPVSE